MEIERKFLLARVPHLEKFTRQEIEQVYLAIKGGAEVRLRKKGDEFTLAVKNGEGRVRFEGEISIPKEAYASLKQTTKWRVEKTRYLVPIGNLVAELDVFHGSLDGLRVVEVEFNTVAEADGFVPPDWFGADVTEKERYANRNLAVFGLNGLL